LVLRGGRNFAMHRFWLASALLCFGSLLASELRPRPPPSLSPLAFARDAHPTTVSCMWMRLRDCGWSRDWSVCGAGRSVDVPYCQCARVCT
jgi:hypothetical protein